MKNHYTTRTPGIVLFAAIALLFASNAFASFNAYLDFKDEKTGKVTKVKLAQDGSFESPVMPAGTYICSWSFGTSNQTTVGSGGMSSGRAVGTFSDGTSATQSVSPAAATLTYTVQAPRESSSGMASGKRQHQPVTVSKSIDKASPNLFNFEKITIDNGDKISGKLELQDAAGKACSIAAVAGYDVKSVKK